MEDFDCSVENCDRDWECFFKECEDCNLLSPVLAGFESGMSDFDDATSIFANIVHSTTDFPEENRTNDGPPECDGSPAGNYLSGHRRGGMESILSGSEEDIHLQCVNIFLEKLTSDGEVQEFAEPRTQGRPWAEKQKNPTQEEGCCACGKPEANLRFNHVSAKSERTAGLAIEPLIKGHNGKKTTPRDEPHSNPASTVSDLNPLLQDKQSACPRVGLFVSEEVCMETKLNELTRSTQPCHSWNHVGAAETLKQVNMARGVAKPDSESSPLGRHVSTFCSKQDVMMHERANDDLSVTEPAGAKSNKLANHDLSSSAAAKRRRRRKRRLVELADSMHSCEKHDFVKSSDSEEEQCAFFTHELQKSVHGSPIENSPAVSCSGKVPVRDNKTNDLPCQILQGGIQKITPGFRNSTTNGSTDISDRSGNPTMPSENPCILQVEQSSHLDKSPASQMVKSVCVYSESKQPCNAEVNLGRLSVLTAAELNNRAVEREQNNNVSATKTTNVISDMLSNAMHRQQLEHRSSLKDQDAVAMEYKHFTSVSEFCPNISDPGNANPERSTICLVPENSQLAECATLAVDAQESQPGGCPSSNISAQPEEHPEISSWTKSEVMSQSEVTAELRCPSDLTAVSSCWTGDTRSLTSLSNEGITEMSDCSCAPISQTSQTVLGDKTLFQNHKEVDGHQSWSASNDAADLRCDVALKDDNSAAVTEAETVPDLVPDSKNSVFVMSSFWREMEKLTINDILGSRTISGAASDRRLPPVQEDEPMDVVDLSDSGFFTQPDEPKPEGTREDSCIFQSSMDNLSQNDHLGPPQVTEDVVLTPPMDSFQPASAAAVQTGLRRMTKNMSVHNLPALEAGDYTGKTGNFPKQIEEEFEDLDDFIAGEEGDCPDSAATHTFSMPLGGIFDFIFGRRQSHSRPPATDDLSSSHSYGSSVSETYDHFFSEFDTESFFYPFSKAKSRVKDDLVPVFSCSARRNIQYPEVYECFFGSSSSDESSTESDEEENHSPIRVVSRFNRTSSSSKFPTDRYDCFFTDKDLKQNLFWKNLFSFRNMSLNGSGLKQQNVSNSLVTVRPLQRTFLPLGSLRNQDASFLDPALDPCGDRFFRQLSQQQLDFENFQMNPNPRLDSPLLPLRQSDMCLVCIAFASWVLKTANPQVGDAWKAVLLANVSALSAIRYLRKYVKTGEAASDRKHLN